ncbi:MAG: 1-acyl-sn-glycerol-3-phosphate acyltransferase [Chitinophagales bacterium]|nr:1-acyl-sn-glycerol-3-phosphate acyltransferase [Chitinophagales bacterium]
MFILRYLYTIWAALLFFFLGTIGMLVFTIAGLFPKKTALRICLTYNWLWVHAWGLLTGVRYRISGAEHIDRNKAYVFVANHGSMSDAITTNASIPVPFAPMAKKEVRKIPVLGYLFSKVAVFVDRSNPESRKSSLAAIIDLAEKGISTLLFPEGTRNRTGAIPLQTFKAGAFVTAIETQLPIAPFVIIGARQLLPNEKPPMHPTTFTIVFAPPIDTKGMTENDVDRLRNEVFVVMERLLITHDPQYKNFPPTTTLTPTT